MSLLVDLIPAGTGLEEYRDTFVIVDEAGTGTCGWTMLAVINSIIEKLIQQFREKAHRILTVMDVNST